MKVVLVKENGKIRLLEGKGEIEKTLLALRSRLTGGNMRFYELNYKERVGCPLEGYIAALNKFPELLEETKLIKAID